MKLYKSYGVLAHEKQPVYTLYSPASDIYDEVNVVLPDGWYTTQTVFDETLICSPDGDTYFANEILSNWGDSPALVWYDNRQKMHRIMLEVVI